MTITVKVLLSITTCSDYFKGTKAQKTIQEAIRFSLKLYHFKFFRQDQSGWHLFARGNKVYPWQQLACTHGFLERASHAAKHLLCQTKHVSLGWEAIGNEYRTSESGSRYFIECNMLKGKSHLLLMIVMLQVGTFDLKASYGIIPCKNTEYVSALWTESVEISSMLEENRYPKTFIQEGLLS